MCRLRTLGLDTRCLLLLAIADRMTNSIPTPAVALRCLGTFEVTIDTATVTAFPTDKVRALLAYLALEDQTAAGGLDARSHRREVLAGLFWPEMPDDMALANLRLTIHRLRQTLDRTVPGASA